MTTNIATISYAIVAIAFITLSVLLFTSWRGRLRGMALTVACVLTAVWATAVAVQVASGTPFSLVTDVLEIVRSAAWSAFLLILLSPVQQPVRYLPFRATPYGAALALLYLSVLALTIYSYAYPGREFAFGALAMSGNIIGRVMLAVAGVLLVEQLYRNTPPQQRWGIKFACIGIGALFTYDLYLYSDAMLFRTVNSDLWAARGVVNALSVPLIAVSAARNPQWSLDVAVSRRIVFHSAALFGCAFYLLTMAAAGYYLRYFGGNWGTVMQVAFLFGALVLLVAVLFSGSARSWLKVFISKHFYNYNYDYREEWLRFTRTLSKDGPSLGERTIRVLADLVESPAGALFIQRESGRYEPAAQQNMPAAPVSEPAASALCRFLASRQWVIDLQEYDDDPRKYGDLSIPPWLRAYPKPRLVVPLLLHENLFGFVVLAQPRSRLQMNWEKTDLLKIAGSQAASYLAQQESANALAVARQFESFNRMSAFVVHDVKNLVSQLSLLVSNAERHKDNPAFQRDMIETVGDSVRKMKTLLLKLSAGHSLEMPASLLMDELLERVVADKAAYEPKPVLEIQDSGLAVSANRDRLERVIGHIIQNAVEATPKTGRVVVRLARHEDHAVVELEDNGKGMSEAFVHERLFQPFVSTKAAGMGIGMFESRMYIHEIGGRIEVASRELVGTTFRVILPLLRRSSQSALDAA